MSVEQLPELLVAPETSEIDECLDCSANERCSVRIENEGILCREATVKTI